MENKPTELVNSRIDCGTCGPETVETSTEPKKHAGGRKLNPPSPTTAAECWDLHAQELTKAKPNVARLAGLVRQAEHLEPQEAAAKIKAEADAKTKAEADEREKLERIRNSEEVTRLRTENQDLKEKAAEVDSARAGEASAVKTAKDAVAKMNAAVLERDKAVSAAAVSRENEVKTRKMIELEMLTQLGILGNRLSRVRGTAYWHSPEVRMEFQDLQRVIEQVKEIFAEVLTLSGKPTVDNDIRLCPVPSLDATKHPELGPNIDDTPVPDPATKVVLEPLPQPERTLSAGLFSSSDRRIFDNGRLVSWKG